MAVSSGPGFSLGGPRVFPNGNGRSGPIPGSTTPTPPTPPVFLHRSERNFDNRTAVNVDARVTLVANNERTYDADNRTSYVYQS